VVAASALRDRLAVEFDAVMAYRLGGGHNCAAERLGKFFAIPLFSIAYLNPIPVCVEAIAEAERRTGGPRRTSALHVFARRS
jgi:hypothetical protein